MFRHAVACLLIAGTISSASADTVCDVSLFRHFESENISDEKMLFFLDLVNEGNFDKAKTTIGIKIPSYFQGNYSQFNEKRRSFRQQTEARTLTKYSRQYALDTLSETGLKAYEACLKAQRKETDLLIYRNGSGTLDKRLTFVVVLDTQVRLKPPLRINVFGADRLLSDVDDGTKVQSASDKLVISVDNPIGHNQFTVERKDPRVPIEVTAQISGKAATPLEVGPALSQIEKDIVEEVVVSNTINYLARRLQPGTDRHDFVWGVDGVSPNGNQVANGETFVGKACLCPSGQRVSWDAGWRTAGTCVPPKPSARARLILSSVAFAPADKLQPYGCGGQEQVPVKKSLQFGPDGACFDVQLSLNAPPDGSKQCNVEYRISGKVVKTMSVMEPKK